MHKVLDTRKKTAGVALVTALALLLFFSILATVYARYAMLETEATRLDLDKDYARQTARAGIEATLGEIEVALEGGKAPDDRYEFTLPVYVAENRDQGFSEGVIGGVAKVVVTDESAKINLNFAPVRVLEAILNIDANTARQIRQELPKIGVPDAENQGRWLTSIDDLAIRGLLNERKVASLNRDLLTVHSVLDPARPEAFINLNSAPAPVIAAVLNVPGDVAEAVVKNRPYSSLEELVAVTGTTPAMFNVTPDPEAPAGLPRELSFTSRCFRIRCEGSLINKEIPDKPLAADWVEAIVLFPEKGAPVVRYWTESRPEEPAAT